MQHSPLPHTQKVKSKKFHPFPKAPKQAWAKPVLYMTYLTPLSVHSVKFHLKRLIGWKQMFFFSLRPPLGPQGSGASFRNVCVHLDMISTNTIQQ